MAKYFTLGITHLLRVILCLVAAFGQGWAQSQAAQTDKIQHFIFLIHGIGGNGKSFGVMESALKTHLNRSGELGRVEVKTFQYETEKDELTTDDFALQFNNFIVKTVSENDADPNYGISIVAHSQGGLISTILYFNSYSQKTEGFSREISQRLANVVTLGTPFWGSKIATIEGRHPEVLDFVVKHLGTQAGPLAALGKRQINDMQLGSPVIQMFRQNSMTFTREDLQRVHEHIRVLNISGNANLKRITEENGYAKKYGIFKKEVLEMLLPFVFGVTEYEADGLVSVPASTINTISMQNLDSNYDENETLGPEKFSEIDIADRLVVKAVHASPEAETFYDLTYIPEKCLANEKCEHPTYNYLLNYLRGISIEELTAESRKNLSDGEVWRVGRVYRAPNVKLHNFGGFTIDVRVRLPEGQEDQEDLKQKIKVSISPWSPVRQTGLERGRTPRLKVNPLLEISSHVRTYSEVLADSVFEWKTGHFLYVKNAESNNNDAFRNLGTSVLVRISAPGMKSRKIIAPVKPMLSTFIDVQLAPRD